MTALTAAASRARRNDSGIMFDSRAIATSEVIYAGALVAVDTNGRLIAAAAAASTNFMGMAIDTDSGNAAGTRYARFIWNCEVNVATNSTLSTDHIGMNCVCVDDNFVDVWTAYTSAISRCVAGEVVGFDSSGNAWVALRRNSTKGLTNLHVGDT